LPKIGWAEAPSSLAMGFYLTLWGLFTLFLFIGTLKLNGKLMFVFGSLTLLFFLLAIGDFTGIELIKKIAGYEGIICGLSAMYTSLSLVLEKIM